MNFVEKFPLGVYIHMGANTPKWIAIDLCLVLSGSNSKVYTNFEFGKYHRHFKNKLIYKAKQFMMTKIISSKIHIFRR
jgi:hypothetical protein